LFFLSTAATASKRESAPLPEQPSAHNDLVGIVGVKLVANVIEAPAGAEGR
jgi:hypothetical protein